MTPNLVLNAGLTAEIVYMEDNVAFLLWCPYLYFIEGDWKMNIFLFRTTEVPMHIL